MERRSPILGHGIAGGVAALAGAHQLRLLLRQSEAGTVKQQGQQSDVQAEQRNDSDPEAGVSGRLAGAASGYGGTAHLSESGPGHGTTRLLPGARGRVCRRRATRGRGSQGSEASSRASSAIRRGGARLRFRQGLKVESLQVHGNLGLRVPVGGKTLRLDGRRTELRGGLEILQQLDERLHVVGCDGDRKLGLLGAVHARLNGDDLSAGRKNFLEIKEHLGPGKALAQDQGVQENGVVANLLDLGPAKPFVPARAGSRARSCISPLEAGHLLGDGTGLCALLTLASNEEPRQNGYEEERHPGESVARAEVLIGMRRKIETYAHCNHAPGYYAPERECSSTTPNKAEK